MLGSRALTAPADGWQVSEMGLDPCDSPSTMSQLSAVYFPFSDAFGGDVNWTISAGGLYYFLAYSCFQPAPVTLRVR